MSTSKNTKKNNSLLFFKCIENIEKQSKMKKLQEIQQKIEESRGKLNKRELDLENSEKKFAKKMIKEKSELYDMVSFLIFYVFILSFIYILCVYFIIISCFSIHLTIYLAWKVG